MTHEPEKTTDDAKIPIDSSVLFNAMKGFLNAET